MTDRAARRTVTWIPPKTSLFKGPLRAIKKKRRNASLNGATFQRNPNTPRKTDERWERRSRRSSALRGKEHPPRRNGRGTAGRGGETAETKEVQTTGISGKSDQDFADCGGNRGYLLFWRTFSACAALDLPEIAGMACAEPVKERLAAGGKIGFAF